MERSGNILKHLSIVTPMSASLFLVLRLALNKNENI